MGLFIPPMKMMAQLGPQRKTITLTIAEAKGTLQLPSAFEMIRTCASSPGRFRLYQDAASREADADRTANQDLEPGKGGISDTTHEPEALMVTHSPEPKDIATVPGTPRCWAWSGALGAVITLEILQVEA